MGWAKKAPTIEFPEAFRTFDEYSCYWGGFLAADGNVDSKQRVRLMLNYDDTSHLEKFRDFLGSTYAISSNTEKYYRSSFEFTCKEMCEDLRNNFLIVPNKTDKLEFPKHIPKYMMRHYIRGYFDGDGSVCESFSNINSITATLYTTFCSGSISYAKDLYEFLALNVGLKGNLQEYPGKFQLKYNTNDSKKLLEWMYADSEVYLNRKYAKYIELVVNDNRSTRTIVR